MAGMHGASLDPLREGKVGPGQSESALKLPTTALLPQNGSYDGSAYQISAAKAIAERFGSDPELSAGLRSLPALMIITDSANLFSPETGIYVHPTERGPSWERPAFLEMRDGSGSRQFGIRCGLRIHGGLSRRPEESPKHSFRLIFQPPHGTEALRFPLFGTAGVREFSSLLLRAGNNDSWLSSNGAQRRRATYLRDEWMRRSMQAMGYPSVRGVFVHVYLNGFYWGLYNLCEAPNPSVYAQDPLGPTAEYDARKGDSVLSGDNEVWAKMTALADAGLADERRYEEIGRCLDLIEFVDYLVLNCYVGNTDWDRSSNWIAVRPRKPGGRFQFLPWDAEVILDNPEVDMLGFDDDESPMHLLHRLADNARFRRLFADRVQRLLFGSGPLAPTAAAERCRVLAEYICKAMTPEAARWGTYRLEVHPYKTGPYECLTVAGHWQPEIDRLTTRYFPQRREVLLRQFQACGLFPEAN
jgi:hypothetical protein